MIPKACITQWALDHPWSTSDQVEQDLLLAQAMCEIAQDPLLGEELVIRGGTAFHKLYLPKPYRYSEDLDYVRVTAGGIGEIMKRLTSLGKELGYSVRTQMSMQPKVFWRFTAESGVGLKIKIEINTFERSPVLPLASRLMSVKSLWCDYAQKVATFQPEELVATKLRALYQRSKGRDLFDLWLALTVLNLDPRAIVEAFPVYRPEGLTAKLMEANLRAKLEDRMFCHDCDSLVVADASGYDPQEAGELILAELIARLH